MRGRIVKGIGGFYYIHSYTDNEIYQCKAKGIFRKEKISPVVGDEVEFEVTHEKDREGSIILIAPRKTFLERPCLSNITKAFIVISVAGPKPNLFLLDKYITFLEYKKIKINILINKIDLDKDNYGTKIKKIYENINYKVVLVSTINKSGIDGIKDLVKNEVVAFCGPSGVGKSSIVNLLLNKNYMETGNTSKKLGRGKHTTRYSEVIIFDEDSYIVDTPGFTSVLVPFINKNELSPLFRDINEFKGDCKYNYCSHIAEENCAVKEALEKGKIEKSRYDTYVKLYRELEKRRLY